MRGCRSVEGEEVGVGKHISEGRGGRRAEGERERGGEEEGEVCTYQVNRVNNNQANKR
jgi:hypothetical protein